jgi:hypothetical protein
VNFNYRRCDDSLWEYQVELNPNQTKNIWLIDNTYSIAPSFRSSVVLVNLGVFPAVSATPTQTPTQSTTPTQTPTQTQTPTNTSTPTQTSTNTPTPTNTGTPTQTPTSTVTSTSTPTPTNTQTSTSTPTPTNTETPTQTPTNTASPTNTPTNTASPTQTISYYSYSLGYGATIQESCNDSNSPSNYYGAVSGGIGPNVGEFLYDDTLLSTPASNGYYSNGISWFLITGGLGEITSSDPNGCVGVITLTPTPTLTQTPTNTTTQSPTPSVTASNTPTPTTTPTNTPTANRFPFTVYPGSTYDAACGQYNSTVVIYGDSSLFDNNTVFYNNIVGPDTTGLTGYYNYSQIVVQLNNGVESGGFSNCITLTPTQTLTQTPTNTPTTTQTPTQTLTQTPTNTETSTPTPTNTSTPTNTASVTPTNTASTTPTPTPTQTRFAFTVYPGSTYDEACGQYNSTITIYGDKVNFDENTIFYNVLAGPTTIDMTGYYNNSQNIVQLSSDGSIVGGFSICVTLTPTQTVTQTQTQTPTNTPTLTQTQTQTPTLTQTPTQTIGYYTYTLGYDATVPATACDNFDNSPITLYGAIAAGIGPNLGEILYTNTLLSTTASNGYYSNGTATYQVTGGVGEVTSVNPLGCATPIIIQLEGFYFEGSVGAGYQAVANQVVTDDITINFTNVLGTITGPPLVINSSVEILSGQTSGYTQVFVDYDYNDLTQVSSFTGVTFDVTGSTQYDFTGETTGSTFNVTPTPTPSVTPSNTPEVTGITPTVTATVTSTPGGETPTPTPTAGGETPTPTPTAGGETPTPTPTPTRP